MMVAPREYTVYSILSLLGLTSWPIPNVFYVWYAFLRDCNTSEDLHVLVDVYVICLGNCLVTRFKPAIRLKCTVSPGMRLLGVQVSTGRII